MTVQIDNYIPTQVKSVTYWREAPGVPLYAEKVFPNRKVGHVTASKNTQWRASLDGIGCGFTDTAVEAKALVEMRYEEKYGR